VVDNHSPNEIDQLVKTLTDPRITLLKIYNNE